MDRAGILCRTASHQQQFLLSSCS